jgi:hypothetical protein
LQKCLPNYTRIVLLNVPRHTAAAGKYLTSQNRAAYIGESPCSLKLQLLFVIIAKELHKPFHDTRLSHNLLYGWLLLYRQKLPEVASSLQLKVTILGHELVDL